MGAGKTTSVNKLAGILIMLTCGLASAVSHVYAESRPGDPRQSHADISTAKTFGHNPHYSLDEGSKITCQHFET
ncbi:MAG: hypothetical protein WC364_09065 [Eubacteriales bacterium]